MTIDFDALSEWMDSPDEPKEFHCEKDGLGNCKTLECNREECPKQRLLRDVTELRNDPERLNKVIDKLNNPKPHQGIIQVIDYETGEIETFSDDQEFGIGEDGEFGPI